MHCPRLLLKNLSTVVSSSHPRHSSDLSDHHQQWRQYSVNGGSLRRQMVCHLAAVYDGKPVRNKPEWNLEPARPYVDQATAVAQYCNPY